MKITQCRVCAGDLESVLELGEFALCGHFPHPDEEIPVEPMGLSACNQCGLVQMHYSYKQQMYGADYGYRSGLNKSMVKHLSLLAREAVERVTLRSQDVVLDIGGNDGTLLQAIEHENRVLIDPTAPNWDIQDKKITVIPELFSDQIEKAKLIFSVAMFYDLEDPCLFAADVARILDPNGVWVLEQSHLPTMVINTAFDTICHEHLEYYSLATLNVIMEWAGLEIIDAVLNGCNGGSVRITVAHRGRFERTQRFCEQLVLDVEFEREIHAEFKAMERRMVWMRQSLLNVIEIEQTFGRRVVGFGASTKGNTLLQYCGLTNAQIPFIVDINKDKHWRETPGTHIPIVSEDWARAFLPYTYLVLPWHFRGFILETQSNFLRDGGKYLFPLPEVELVGSEAMERVA